MITALAVFDILQLKGADLEVAGPIPKSERGSTDGMAPTVNHRSFELS